MPVSVSPPRMLSFLRSLSLPSNVGWGWGMAPYLPLPLVLED